MSEDSESDDNKLDWTAVTTKRNKKKTPLVGSPHTTAHHPPITPDSMEIPGKDTCIASQTPIPPCESTKSNMQPIPQPQTTPIQTSSNHDTYFNKFQPKQKATTAAVSEPQRTFIQVKQSLPKSTIIS
jgi:hypothetical protein